MVEGSFMKAVVNALRGHPEAILAFAMASLAATLLWHGHGPYISVGVPGAFYVIYLARMLMQDKHRERLAEMDVKRVESGKGKSIRTRNIGQVKKARDRQNGTQG